MPSQISTVKRGLKLVYASLIPSPTTLFLILFLILSLLMNGRFFPLIKRGFFCNDTTIRYPIRPDTVDFKLLFLMAIILPSIVIAFLERRLARILESDVCKQGIRTRKDSNNQQDASEEEEELMQLNDRIKRQIVVNDDGDSDLEAIGQSNIYCDSNDTQGVGVSVPTSNHEAGTSTVVDGTSNVRFRTSGRHFNGSLGNISDLQLFMFGFTVTSFLTGLGKTTSGRLRPHFMARCKPDVDCALPANFYRYIDNFKCTDETLRPPDISYITTSWPSGHASLIFFSMFYLIFYLNSIIPMMVGPKTPRISPIVRYNPLLTYGIYVLMVGLAIFISITRVSDYHHHPLDVLSGALLGSIIAVIMSQYLVKQRFVPLARLQLINS